jgi:hypothetical protein
MPRYFFHVHLDETVELDPIRLELANLGEAIVEANRARVEIMTEDAVDRLWLEIADQNGRFLVKVG